MLQPGGRGDFIVIADGRELWNKNQRADDAFPRDEDILSQLGG